MSEPDKNKIVLMCRAIIATQKVPTVQDLIREYKIIDGCNIPYQRLGFRSLEEFLEATGEFQVGADQRVYMRTNVASQHMQKLVRETVTKKKKKVKKPTNGTHFGNSPWMHPRFSYNMVSTLSYYSARNNNYDWGGSGRRSSNPVPLRSAAKPRIIKPVILENHAVTVNKNMDPVKTGAESKQEPPVEYKNVVTNEYSEKVGVVLQNAEVEQKQPNQATSTQSQTQRNSKQAVCNVQQSLFQMELNKTKTVILNVSQAVSAASSSRDVKALEVKPLDIQSQPQNAINELNEYCQGNNFEMPQYKIFKMSSGRLQCSVWVNGNCHSSYPYDFNSTYGAKLKTARIALIELHKLSKQEHFPASNLPNSELVTKVYECLKLYAHGVFLENFSELFENMYKMSLPNNWFEVITQYQTLFNISNFINHKIISITSSTDANTCASIINSQSCDRSDDHTDILQLPWTDKRWRLFITNPISTVEIWARLIDDEFSYKFNTILKEIESDLRIEKKKLNKLTIGHTYLMVRSNFISRVRIIRIDLERAECLYFEIDTGVESWISMNYIFECKRDVQKFPPQAIRLSLSTLDEFSQCPNAECHLQDLLKNQSLIGEILTTKEEYEQLASSNPSIANINVVLYETASELDLNYELLLRFCGKDAAPKLQMSLFTDVVISYVSINGNVYCQLRDATDGIKFIHMLIHQKTQSGFDVNKHKLLAEQEDICIHSRTFFLVHDTGDDQWYRGQIRSSTATEYKIFYVDYGMTRMVRKESVFRLDSLSTALLNYPAQSILCCMSDVTCITENMIDTLKYHLKSNTAAMVKLVDVRSSAHFVQIFVPNDNRSWLNINKTLQSEFELENSAGIIHELPMARSAVLPTPPKPCKAIEPCKSSEQFKPSKPCTPIKPYLQETDMPLPFLKKSELPDVQTMFMVEVISARHPNNFKVRLHEDNTRFQNLVANLQDHYENQTYIEAVDLIEIGQAYACKHNVYNWCRVIVRKLHKTRITVRYCDYGEVALVTSCQLKELPMQFRTLPTLAINASLYGIKPKYDDWTNEDCAHFQLMTVGSKFVARIKNIVQKSSNTVMLNLILYDVSSAQDVIINTELIAQQRATQLNAFD